MLNGSKLFDIFCKEAIHIDFHISNKGFLRTNSDKTPYELWKSRPASIKNFKVFGRKFYIKRNEDNLGKFHSRIDEEILLGYSSNIKAYRCYNLRLSKVVTSVDVIVDDRELS